MTFRERVDIISCPTAPAVTPLTHTPLGAHGVGAGFQQGIAHQGRVIVFKRKKKKTGNKQNGRYFQRDSCAAEELHVKLFPESSRTWSIYKVVQKRETGEAWKAT